MTNAMRSRLADLKTIGLVIAIVSGMAGGAWKVIDLINGKMDRSEAEASRSALHQRISRVKEVVDKNTHDVEQVQQTIGRDVRTIKCILTAPSRKAKGNCGLED
jgi:hypothetical protein